MSTVTGYLKHMDHPDVTLKKNGERAVVKVACSKCYGEVTDHIIAWTPPEPGTGFGTAVQFTVCLQCGYANIPRERIVHPGTNRLPQRG